MTDLILKIYGYLRMHRSVCILSFVVVTLLLILSVLRLNYKEDIADFLPLDAQHQNAMKVYQDISGANKIFAIFEHGKEGDSPKDKLTSVEAIAYADELVTSIDEFTSLVEQADTAHEIKNLMAQVDIEKMTEVTDFVYNNISYFLTDADYARMDSLLAQPDYISRQLDADKQMLMFPAGGLLSDNIQRDPLNLFTPVVQKLQRSDNSLKYEIYDGHIFSPDMQHSVQAIVMMDSPYGASETENNARLTKMLEACADSVMAAHNKTQSHNAQCKGEVKVTIIGGPVIAVTNATQIKTDSILAVSIAVALILALLLFTFRNIRNLLLIALSIGWGWLFAMGGLALVHDKVSIIVIGISSVIVGIAVNYPLHFIAHLGHTPDKRKALREIVMPLVVGNVTTVGAFLALVPLQSVALRDLGLFSSLLLVGTILFVIIYLPHLVQVRQSQSKLEDTSVDAADNLSIVNDNLRKKANFLDKLSEIKLENKPVFVWVILILTLVFGYFSLDTKFDSNMAHINYMTDSQKAIMEYFQRTMMQGGDYQKVYVLSTDSTMDGALDKSLRLQHLLQEMKAKGEIHEVNTCSQFIISRSEQQRRLQRWDTFWKKHFDSLKPQLQQKMQAEGFAADSFDDFYAIVSRRYLPQQIAYFAPLTQSLFAGNISVDSVGKRYNVVNVLSVKEKNVKRVEDLLSSPSKAKSAKTDKRNDGCYTFDVASMNSAIANHLSNDFNYIGFACGFIVFFFLWLSMGSIELAVLSFIPMAVSWLWILGIMAIGCMEFNIVNIILATFIFGQGDDYTIFMAEGAMYEYAYRRKMLASYKHSIIISALIMFIGIGTLIIAKHPALHSLAEVTIAGMFSVVLMAYVFPPLIFKYLVSKNGKYRLRPLSLTYLFHHSKDDSRYLHYLVLDRYRYKGVEVFGAVKRNLRRTHDYQEWIADQDASQPVVVENAGYGEQAMMFALLHPEAQVIAVEADAEKCLLMKYSMKGIVNNVEIINSNKYEREN